MPTNRAASQAHAYGAVIRDGVRDTFASAKPADRIIGARFREDRRFGSRDRRMISETFFAVFRWWGWLQGLADGLRPADAPVEVWARCLLAAHLLDSREVHPAARAWAATAGHHGDLAAWGDLPVDDRARALARAFHIPAPSWRDLVPAWLYDDLPLDEDHTRRLVRTLQERPPMWLRAQTDDVPALIAELRAADVEVRPYGRLDNALEIPAETRVNLYQLDAFRAGRFEVQDLASQVIGLVCAAHPGERWWDACAGAGGKSLQLSCQMANKGTVVASDVRAWKLTDLRKRARRAGRHNIEARPWDGRKVPAKDGSFDGVLVDAPCSCSGTWRRNPDGRWTTTADEVAEIRTMQAEIVDRAARGVRPGGILVYATCSLSRRENEEVVAEFLAAHPEFVLDPVAHPLTGAATDGRVRVWPYDANCDATFATRLRHQE